MENNEKLEMKRNMLIMMMVKNLLALLMMLSTVIYIAGYLDNRDRWVNYYSDVLKTGYDMTQEEADKFSNLILVATILTVMTFTLFQLHLIIKEKMTSIIVMACLKLNSIMICLLMFSELAVSPFLLVVAIFEALITFLFAFVLYAKSKAQKVTDYKEFVNA